MTILQENGRANGTPDGLAEATLGSYRTLMEGVIALHELNTKLAVRWIGGPDDIFRSPLETNRRIAEVKVEQSRTQQEALQVLDEELKTYEEHNRDCPALSERFDRSPV